IRNIDRLGFPTISGAISPSRASISSTRTCSGRLTSVSYRDRFASNHSRLLFRARLRRNVSAAGLNPVNFSGVALADLLAVFLDPLLVVAISHVVGTVRTAVRRSSLSR